MVQLERASKSRVRWVSARMQTRQVVVNECKLVVGMKTVRGTGNVRAPG